MNSGFSSLHWEFLYRSWLGKTLPNSSDKPCKKLSNALPWAAQDVQRWSWTPHSWKKATRLRRKKEELEKAAYSSSSSTGLQFCSPQDVSHSKILLCITEAVGRVSIDQRLANYSPEAKSNSLPIFVNKVLLEHSHTHLFLCCLWLPLCYMMELNSCKRPNDPQAKNIYYLALYRKSWWQGGCLTCFPLSVLLVILQGHGGLHGGGGGLRNGLDFEIVAEQRVESALGRRKYGSKYSKVEISQNSSQNSEESGLTGLEKMVRTRYGWEAKFIPISLCSA